MCVCVRACVRACVCACACACACACVCVQFHTTCNLFRMHNSLRSVNSDAATQIIFPAKDTVRQKYTEQISQIISTTKVGTPRIIQLS